MARNRVYVSQDLIEKAKAASGQQNDIDVIKDSLKVYEAALLSWKSRGEVYAMKGNARQFMPPERTQDIFYEPQIRLNNQSRGLLARMFEINCGRDNDYAITMPRELFNSLIESVNTLKDDKAITSRDKYSADYVGVYLNASLKCFTRFAKMEREGYQFMLVDPGSETPKPIFQ